MQTTGTLGQPRGAWYVVAKVRQTMARAVVEPNGFWKSLAMGLAAIVVAMLGWFLIDQAQQDRAFRTESREYWRQFDQRLNLIERRIDAELRRDGR